MLEYALPRPARDGFQCNGVSMADRSISAAIYKTMLTFAFPLPARDDDQCNGIPMVSYLKHAAIYKIMLPGASLDPRELVLGTTASCWQTT